MFLFLLRWDFRLLFRGAFRTVAMHLLSLPYLSLLPMVLLAKSLGLVVFNRQSVTPSLCFFNGVVCKQLKWKDFKTINHIYDHQHIYQIEGNFLPWCWGSRHKLSACSCLCWLYLHYLMKDSPQLFSTAGFWPWCSASLLGASQRLDREHSGKKKSDCCLFLTNPKWIECLWKFILNHSCFFSWPLYTTAVCACGKYLRWSGRCNTEL